VVGAILLTILLSLALRSSAREEAGPWLLASYLACGVWWVVLVRTAPIASRRKTFVIALLLRVAFSIPQPLLSADVYRYLWDGNASKSGMNPYARSPDDPAVASLREDWHAQINHAEVPTIYPPYAQLFFLLASAGGSLVAWRLLLLLAEIVTLHSLLEIDHSNRLAVLYATCPMVLVEGFWSAHVEVVAVTFLVTSLAAMRRGSEKRAAVLAGIAVGIKLSPLAAVPAILFRAKERRGFAAWLALALFLPAVPFLGRPFMLGVVEYATRWSFNSAAYDLAVFVERQTALAERAKRFWTAVKDPLEAERISRFVYERLYPEMIARCLLGLTALVLILYFSRRAVTLERSIMLSLATLLLLSPVIHPWYWLITIPFALMSRSRTTLWLATLSPLSYLLYGDPSLKWWVLLMCYGVPFAAAAMSLSRGRR